MGHTALFASACFAAFLQVFPALRLGTQVAGVEGSGFLSKEGFDFGDRLTVTGPRYWCEHGHLECGGCGTAEAAALR